MVHLFEELYLRGYNAVSFVEGHPTFRRNVLPSSGPKNKPSKKLARRQVDIMCLSHVPSKRQLTVNGLHGFMSQKTELFITTGVRTSNTSLFPYF
jgi:hypothetical protein